jgi:peptide/nickel transport system permease protein
VSTTTIADRTEGLRGAALAPARGVRTLLGGNGVLFIGVAIVATMVLLGLLAPLLAPAPPNQQNIAEALLPPGTAGHPLGTDDLGRDVLSRVLYAARVDLLVGCSAVVLPFLIGSVLGGVAGYVGGWVDGLIMRLVDLVFAFPVLVLLLALVVVMGVVSIIVAITIVDWVAYARLSRTLVRGEREKNYVLAARVAGLSHSRILFRHIFPNTISQPIVYAFSDAVVVIVAIITLGFLGLGIPPPAPDWGTMISDAQPFIGLAWWIAVFPGVAILLTGLGLSLIADGLATKLSISRNG